MAAIFRQVSVSMKQLFGFVYPLFRPENADFFAQDSMAGGNKQLIFDAAMQFESQAERDAYVLKACCDDEKLLVSVRALHR